MDVNDAILKRRSIRAYLPDPIPKEKLEKIFEAARLAPSAANIQPRHFIMVTDQQKRKELSGIFSRFLSEAPVIIVGCGNRKASKWFIVDTVIAMQNMVLAATGEGLGTCWIGSFNEEKVRKLLKIPGDLDIIALLAIGYSREKRAITAKAIHLFKRNKELKEIISQEEYGEPYLN